MIYLTQGGVLNESRSQRQQKERIRAVREGSPSSTGASSNGLTDSRQYDDEPNENDPLLPRVNDPSVN